MCARRVEYLRCRAKRFEILVGHMPRRSFLVFSARAAGPFGKGATGYRFGLCDAEGYLPSASALLIELGWEWVRDVAHHEPDRATMVAFARTLTD